MGMIYKTFGTEVMGYDDDKLTLDLFISTEDQDDGGDVMKADGMQLRGRPVVLKQHGLDPSWGNEPIAKPLSFRTGIHPTSKSKGIIATAQFYDGSNLTPPDNTGKRLYEKCRDGFMPNASVGWQGIKSHPIPNGTCWDEWSCHEFSIVGVGMNEFAFAPAYKSLTSESSGQKTVTIPLYEHENNLQGDKSMNLKSIANRVSMSMPANNLDMLHNAMMNEMYTKAYGDDYQAMSPEQCATDLLTEHHSLCAPHVAAFIKAYREQAADTKALMVKEFQANAKIFNLNKKSADAPAAEPAPATETQPAASQQPPAQEPTATEKPLSDTEVKALVGGIVQDGIDKVRGKLPH